MNRVRPCSLGLGGADMKTVVKFGVRGGRHCDCHIEPTTKAGNLLASRLAFVFGAKEGTGKFSVRKESPRQSWESSTHFVSVSLLDGNARGPASNKLWPKPYV